MYIHHPCAPIEDAEGNVIRFTYDELSLQTFIMDAKGNLYANGNPVTYSDPSGNMFGTSVEYHYRKHGKEVGATSSEEYVRKAQEFAKTAKKGARKGYVNGEIDGVIRYSKNGKYIDIAPDGSIVSFGKR